MSKWYGSLNNRFMEDASALQPNVGMGATALMYSDRHAYTIIEVTSPSRIIIQRDKAIRTDAHGMSDAQSYTYERDPDGATFIVTKRRDGRWKVAGSSTVIAIGERDEHYDYSF